MRLLRVKCKKGKGKKITFCSEILDEAPPVWVHFRSPISDGTACWSGFIFVHRYLIGPLVGDAVEAYPSLVPGHYFAVVWFQQAQTLRAVSLNVCHSASVVLQSKPRGDPVRLAGAIGLQ